MLTHRPTKTAKTNRAFTLVEMLVVIAITAVLFTLLLGPLINSFRLTQSAQMQVAAQDAARRTSEIISRELGSAAYVFSNTTHPFEVLHPSGSATGIPDARFSNFLVLTVPKKDPTTGQLTTAPAVAFNAKLDFVLPRHNAANQLIDPTTQEPITITKNGAAAPTGFTFPLAPGTSMIRYFIALRQPFIAGPNNTYTANPYATQGEGALLAKNGNNTYVLYRAQFTPSTSIDPTTKKPTVNADKSTVNENLFQPKFDANGNPTNTPEFDDPDFFRIVAVGDPNWLDPNHAGYSAGPLTDPTSAASHNARVAQWFQIAKPVISSPNIDLILLPHNADNTLQYDSTNTTYGNLYGVSHSGAVHDPVTGTDWPVVNTSVTFKFASVSADATAGSTTDNADQGVGSDVAAADSGLPYVPTVYTASDQSWATPYHISLYQYANPGYATFDTNLASASTGSISAGDLIEAMYTSPTDTSGTPVYDITAGTPLAGGNGTYVPMAIDPDTGTINFGMPALPTPGNNYDRYFQVPVSTITNNNGYVDLSTIYNSSTTSPLQTSPLPNVPPDPTMTPLPLTSYQVANARIVPGSVRVYGPDAFPGPNNGSQVLYSAVYPGDAVGPQDNQYEVDYAHNALRMYVSDLDQFASQNPPPVIRVAFDYQANFLPAYNSQSPNPVISAGNPAYPLQVKVDYQTRDLLDINMGVRVYDPNNVGPAQIVTVHNQVRIGNSNR